MLWTSDADLLPVLPGISHRNVRRRETLDGVLLQAAADVLQQHVKDFGWLPVHGPSDALHDCNQRLLKPVSLQQQSQYAGKL